MGKSQSSNSMLVANRDSQIVALLFDEQNAVVTSMITQAIETAHQVGRKIGICGQIPSDDPEFADSWSRMEPTASR